ncbi:MAG: OB-fold domain-containing protein [Rhodobacteraceae bacterium]|nr:OB-fold domain-containing protein [Paracoccaceae bacterium]
MTTTEYFSGPGPEAQFKAFMAEGKFMIQRSAASGHHVFYPRTITPCSGTADLEWVEASGDGTVYASTVTRRRPEQGGDYNIALIDLAEGPRMMARVDGVAPNQVTIGMRVKARVGEIDGETAVIWSPA